MRCVEYLRMDSDIASPISLPSSASAFSFSVGCRFMPSNDGSAGTGMGKSFFSCVGRSSVGYSNMFNFICLRLNES